MKVINLNKKVEIFRDPKTNKYIGFAGNIELYNKNIFIDTRDGTGYDNIIKELDKNINYLSYKYNLSNLGYTFEDTKQHIIMRILEGIPKYNPENKMSLSTFLFMIVERRIINEIRNSNTDSKNPTVLRTSLYTINCKCGNKFIISTSGDDKVEENICYLCNNTLENAKIFSISVPSESIEDVTAFYSKLNKEKIHLNDVISENDFYIPLVFGYKPKLEDQVAIKVDMEKFTRSEDPKIKKLINLVCFNDYSIKAAAKVVGMSHTGATNKLAQLKRKKIIRDLFGR